MKFKTLKIHNFITLRYLKGFLNTITVSEISALEFCFVFWYILRQSHCSSSCPGIHFVENLKVNIEAVETSDVKLVDC